MTNDEIIASNSVRVNDGSGVLVSALSQEYSYVITAAHVLAESNVIKDRHENRLEILSVYKHPDADCAVIKINHVSNTILPTWQTARLAEKASLTLMGFPNSNINTATPLKAYTGQLTSFMDGLIVCTLDGGPGQNSIFGMSGGGIYHVHNGIPYLVGIETRMDDEDQDARWGRVRCYPLSKFNEIIEDNKLAKILPSFLKCFSKLKENMFGYNVIEPTNIEKLQEALLKMADILVEKGLPSPYELMEQYKADLLITYDHPEKVQDRELWEAYFEFIIISALIDDANQVDFTYIKNLERRRRIMYSSDAANWIRKLDEILKAAKRMLEKNGTLIVSSPEPDPEMFPPTSKVSRIVNNITSIPTEGSFLTIDNIDHSVYETFVITHLKALRKKCVVRNEELFVKAGPGTGQLKLFRTFYNEIIK